MPGYASEGQYEDDLLASYRKRGRLPTIRRRDVNLALSPYKAPVRFGGSLVRPKKLVGDKLTYANVRRILGRSASDTKIMSLAISTVLKKDRDRRAKAAIRRRRRRQS